MTQGSSGAQCGNGHAFDRAREGYVNLLLAQHRNSKDPGYGREMIAARRDFFDAGQYETLADDLARLVADSLPGEPGQVMLDAGCGEGYYLRRLERELESRGAAGDTVRCGLDLSKHGIRAAARRDAEGLYAVAGTHRMPVLADRVAVLLTHFSPVSPDDFARVVAPGGVVLVGGPGPDHLYAFKQLLYDAPARHEPAEHFRHDPRFELLDTVRIRHPVSLEGPTEVALLLAMTPFFWTLNAAARARLGAVEQLDTEVDVVTGVYRRTAVPSTA